MVYVHVPFCRSFCTYCDFYSEVASRCCRREDVLRQEALFDGYASALEAEIWTRRNELERVSASGGADTLYIGGGTPSVLPLRVYERLLAALGCTDFSEFTFEVNPEDIVEKGVPYVEGLLELGVNRISMGVQSFDDGILKWMNRRHTAFQAVEAYHILEEAGVKNISIDLIFGMPQLTDGMWLETLRKALEISSSGIPPHHISSYQLSVEPGSMLARQLSKGIWQEASDEDCSRQYEILCDTLSRAGYHHYEISNFAIPGYEAEHNSAYWRHVPYVGLGPGAHSFTGRERNWNKDDLQAYLEAGRCGDFSAVKEGETLDEGQLVMEKIMLGLRTSSGVPEDFLRKHCDEAALEDALGHGDMVRHTDGFICIPEDRFFISDNIISSII